MNKRFFLQGEVLYTEGEIGDEALILSKGKVQLSRRTFYGMNKTVAIVGEGSIVGEMSLIDNERHSVTATALEDGEAFVLTDSDFKERLQNSDRMMRLLLKAFTEKLRSTYD